MCTSLMRNVAVAALRLTECSVSGPVYQAPLGRRCSSSLALRPTGIIGGPGGRQSVSGIAATVFGATGFLGRYVVAQIGASGGRAVCPHRCDDMDMQHLRPMGDLGNIVTPENFDIRDEDATRRMVAKSNVVINLVGANFETWNFSFDEVHVQWPSRLARICADAARVERLIHVSCLGADPASPSARLASKGRGEAALRAAYPAATILRAGPLVGVEDRFLNDMALWRYGNWGVPVVDGGHARAQPVYVLDVAAALYATLAREEALGATYELGGPDVLRMRDIADVVNDELREDRKLAHIPSFLAAPAAALRDWAARRVPLHMLTRDVMLTSSAIAEGQLDRVVALGAQGFRELGIEPQRVTEGVPIEQVRHWRKGGYDVGSNVPENA